MRSARVPERYEHSTGESHAQSRIGIFHNIISQTPTATLDYYDAKPKVVEEILTYIKSQCHGQKFMLFCSLKEFPVKGVPAAKEDLSQKHNHGCFCTIVVKELT